MSTKSLHLLTLTTRCPDDITDCFAFDLSQELAKLGIGSTTLSGRPIWKGKPRSSGSAHTAKQFRYFSVPGKWWVSISGAFLFARIVGQLRELHSAQPIDLIHAHGLLPCGHAAMLLSKELSVPYVISVYGIDDLDMLQSPGRAEKWRRRIALRVCAESRRVVCGSEHVREQVVERANRSCRTSVVYTGVDPELFSPGPEPSGDAITVLSAGNLQAREGHDLVIRSIASLATNFPAISLEIVGDGPERARLQILAKQQSIAGIVHFRRRQPRSEVAIMMKRCTLFALPNQSEGVGCLHLEAMSSGKAVIGCRGQGIAEIIRHGTNGFLVGPDSEKELTLAIRMLLQEPHRRQTLGTAARHTILERLTVEQQAQTLSRIYREVVASGVHSQAH